MLVGKEVPGGEIFIAEPTKPRGFPDIQGISLVPRSLQVSVNSYVPRKKFKGQLVLHPLPTWYPQEHTKVTLTSRDSQYESGGD